MHLGTRRVCVCVCVWYRRGVCARTCVCVCVCVCTRIHFIYLCRTRKGFGGSKMSITAAFRSPLSRWREHIVFTRTHCEHHCVLVPVRGAWRRESEGWGCTAANGACTLLVVDVEWRRVWGRCTGKWGERFIRNGIPYRMRKRICDRYRWKDERERERSLLSRWELLSWELKS